jgi:predicted alpha/beta-fold hydrolase
VKKNFFSLPIPNGSISTILGARLSAAKIIQMSSAPFEVKLTDGSVLTGEFDTLGSPDKVRANILLVHGLGSSCHDPSVVRQARFLASNGYKVFRLNHRNVGSGKGKAQGFYHGDRGVDLKEALVQLQKKESNKAWILIGHSMSGNMALKIAGSKEHSETLKELGCIGVAAISPVVDIKSSSKNMHKPMFGLFNRVFMKKISSYLRRLENLDEALRNAANRSIKLADFDENFLAPALGLANADEFYNRASSRDFLNLIELPTEVFLSKDDPIAPGTYQLLAECNNPNIILHTSRFGGHLGFVHFDLRKLLPDFPIDRQLHQACEKMLARKLR